MWFNVKVQRPKGTTGAQITSYDADGRTKTEATSSRLASVFVTEDALWFAVEYWSDPFPIYVGWTNFTYNNKITLLTCCLWVKLQTHGMIT